MVRSPEDEAKLRQVLERIEEQRSGDCLEVHYKTTSKAKIAIIVLRFKNAEKKDEWKIKPNHFAIAIRSCIDVFPHSNPVVNAALSTLDYGIMRDPSKGPHEAVVDEWKSPKGKMWYFTNFVVHGYIDLPVKDLGSTEEENTYIQTNCKEIGKALLQIAQEEYFKPMYEHAIGKPGAWNAITDPTNANKQYWMWAKSAAVRAFKCDNLNKHLVSNDATDLVGKLYESNQATVKYPAELAGAADEDSDGEDTDNEPFPEQDNEDDDDEDGGDNSSKGSQYTPKQANETKIHPETCSETENRHRSSERKRKATAKAKEAADAKEAKITEE